MKKGFLTFEVLASLGIICLFVAASLLFNTFLVKNKDPNPPASSSALVDKTANWETYTDPIGFSLKYPLDMLPPRYNCNSFILPSTEKERKILEDNRRTGREIQGMHDGLEFGFCMLAETYGIDPEAAGKQHSDSSINFEQVNFAGRKAFKAGSQEQGEIFGEIFIEGNSNNKNVLRLWYRYKEKSQKNLLDQILSTFKFLD